MEEVRFLIPKKLEPYINCIMVQQNDDSLAETSIPLYADGYPGIMFQQSQSGFHLMPKGKKLSDLFLYGQTLEPVSLDATGPYKFIVVQLYPFASKYLLGVDPKVLNDECFDLLQLTHVDVKSIFRELNNTADLEQQVALVYQLILQLIEKNNQPPDDQLQQAISMIIRHEGQVPIKEVRDKVYLTERTFERKFSTSVGLTPKQFAKIIQFQCSLHQLNEANYDRLVEIGMDSGFADQSHFIRTFKKYTGQTPSYYLKQAL